VQWSATDSTSTFTNDGVLHHDGSADFYLDLWSVFNGEVRVCALSSSELGWTALAAQHRLLLALLLRLMC
jgi:hypothetical protein